MTQHARLPIATQTGIFLLILVFFLATAATCDDTLTEDVTPFPYELTRTKDILLTSISGTSFVAGLISSLSTGELSESQIQALDPNDINEFDRSATERWSPAANGASYATVISIGVMPLIVMTSQFARHQKKSGATLLLMYVEAAGLTTGVTGIFKGVVHRDRPFLYNSDLSLQARAEKMDSHTSFFSGHTSLAFCSAVFMSTTFNKLYPQSPWRYVVWPVSLTLASATGLLRYASGKHFPSDIITGAAFGSLVGFLVPLIHRKPSQKFSLYPLNGNIKGIGVLYRF